MEKKLLKLHYKSKYGGGRQAGSRCSVVSCVSTAIAARASASLMSLDLVRSGAISGRCARLVSFDRGLRLLHSYTTALAVSIQTC